MATRDSVLVKIGNLMARITPGDVGRYFATELTFTATHFSCGGKHGYQMHSRHERLYRHKDEALLVPAGLVPLLVNKLRAQGIHVEIENHYTLDPRAKPSEQVLKTANSSDDQFLADVAREPRGLIEASSRPDLVHQIASICRLFPQARIMIAMNGSRHKLQELRKDLKTVGAGDVRTLKGYKWPWQGGRLICSLGHFDDSTNADRDFDIVIFPDAVQAIAPAHQKSLMKLSRHRVYGFVPAGTTVSDRTRLELQALIGPVIHRVPRGAKTEVSVHWCQPPWAPSLGNVSPLSRKRLAYWHNAERNDFVAAIARACSTGDMAKLWQHGLLLTQGSEDGLLGTGPLAVIVLVESTEHGQQLLRRLPGWKLLHAIPKPSSASCKLTNPFEGCSNRIMTYIAASQLPGFGTDVLIWAGPESPEILPSFVRPTLGAEEPVVLIDVADDFDRAAQAAMRRRIRTYAAQGWPSVGVPRSVLAADESISREQARYKNL